MFRYNVIYMKILLFIGALLLVLVMVSGLTEGFTNDEMEGDIKTLTLLYDRSEMKTKNGRQKSENKTQFKDYMFTPNSGDGDMLRALFVKYKDPDPLKDINNTLTVTLAKDRLLDRIKNNSPTV